MKNRVAPALGLGVWMLLASPAAAQRVGVQVPQGPRYAGTPVEIRITVEDFEEDPQPEVRVAAPAEGRLEFVSVSPTISSSITIINGRMSQTKSVRFVYRYRYLATKPGTVEVGPFVVTQGALRQTAPAVRFEIRAVPRSDRVRVAVRLPEGVRYVGQHIPVTLELWLEEGLRENLRGYTLSVPLFDLREGFQYLDDADPRAESNLMIQTGSGPVTLPASVRHETAGGLSYVVVSAARTLVPLRPGRFELEPATAVVEEGTRWRRDFFGGRRATHVRMWSAKDAPRVLRIDPLPRTGRPPSFAGAVGRGYTLDVTADRTVVQVGDPITLTFTLRGEGNLENAALPSLDAEGLLPPDAFRVPEGALPGRYANGAKEFTAVVRVLDESVREIPALPYSWFEAEKEAYVTTLSRPIALSVRPAEVIAAEDVFRGAPEAETPEAETERPDAPRETFTLTGADLAIERDPTRLLVSTRRNLGGPWLPVGLYAGGSLLLAAALLDRRRRDVDPEELRRRKLLEGELRRIRDAARLSGDEAVPELARALRRMLASVPEARSAELDAFLGECDARTYAPEGRTRSATLDARLHARALELARTLAERAR